MKPAGSRITGKQPNSQPNSVRGSLDSGDGAGVAAVPFFSVGADGHPGVVFVVAVEPIETGLGRAIVARQPGLQLATSSLHYSRRNFSGILEAILFHPAIKRIFSIFTLRVFFAVIVLVSASQRVSTQSGGLS